MTVFVGAPTGCAGMLASPDLSPRGRHEVDASTWPGSLPAFRRWNIETELDTIACPVLAVQGTDGKYGTIAQIGTIRTRLPKTRLLAIPECGHSPHRDRPELPASEAARFIHEHPPS